MGTVKRLRVYECHWAAHFAVEIHLSVSSARRGNEMWSRVRRITSAHGAFPVKLIEDEGKRCAAYRLLLARRFPKAGTFKQSSAFSSRVSWPFENRKGNRLLRSARSSCIRQSHQSR